MENNMWTNHHDPLEDFQEGQWWVKELDQLTENPTVTPDQKRAVAVVHNLLRATAAQCSASLVVGELTDDEINDLTRMHGTGGWMTLSDCRGYARAAIAADRALRQATPKADLRPDPNAYPVPQPSSASPAVEPSSVEINTDGVYPARVSGPSLFKDWCSQFFGPDSDESYLAKAVMALPVRAKTTPIVASPAVGDADMPVVAWAGEDGDSTSARSVEKHEALARRYTDPLVRQADAQAALAAKDAEIVVQKKADFLEIFALREKQDMQLTEIAANYKEIAALTAERDSLLFRAQSNELMAECTEMLRQDLIEAGVVGESVPPMMLTEAVLHHVYELRKDADRYRWLRHGDNDEQVLCNGPIDNSYWYLLRNEKLDVAIDTALQVQPSSGA